MAKPKVISAIDDLNLAGFLNGSKLIGDIRTSSTILDNIFANGEYIVIGGESSLSDTTGTVPWSIQVKSYDDGYGIQIAEKMTPSDSRLMFARFYSRSSSSWSVWIEGGGGSTVECDTELSNVSENPVQNKVVKASLDTKMPKSGGTFTGIVYAQANTSYTTYQLRNIALSKSSAVPTGNGSLLGVYS